MAVIPKDQISLCRTHQNKTASLLVFCICSTVSVESGWSYPEVVGRVWVLIAGNNLRSHPVGSPNEGVPAANSPVQLSTHSKIN